VKHAVEETNQTQFRGEMKTMHPFRMLSSFLLAGYLLAACGGTLADSAGSVESPKVQEDAVVFTGIVEAMNAAVWTIDGQMLVLDPQATLDPTIAVGDSVRVEAHVLDNGALVAFKVESSASDDPVSTASAEANSASNPLRTSDSSVSQATGANQGEVFGVVEAITADSLTVGGVTYTVTDSTEIKSEVAVGDQIKLHLIAKADRTFTVLEVEKSLAALDNNSSSGGTDNGPKHDRNDDHGGNTGDSGSGNSGSGGG